VTKKKLVVNGTVSHLQADLWEAQARLADAERDAINRRTEHSEALAAKREQHILDLRLALQIINNLTKP